MCKSTQEGGQRCASHTRARLERKAGAMEAAAAEGDASSLREAQGAWESAAIDYASTREGHEHLRAQADAADAEGDFDTMALLRTVVAKGEAMRAANRDTAAFLKAARMGRAPVAARLSEAAVVASGAPALSAKDQAMWEQVQEDLPPFLEHIESVHTWPSRLSSEDLAEAASTTDSVLNDPRSTDDDLAEVVARARLAASARMYTPEWARAKEAREAGSTMGTQARRELEAEWSRISPQMDAFDAQAHRGLGHPNAGMATFRASDIVSGPTVCGHPNAPIEYVKDVALSKPRAVPEAGWARLRKARFEDNGMALIVAAEDPDAFQRSEALNQVMGMSMDSISAGEREWLARNLHKMPASSDMQRTLGFSLQSWAAGYGDAAERNRLAKAFASSEVESVRALGASTSAGSVSTVPSGPESGEGRRGLFRRR